MCSVHTGYFHSFNKFMDLLFVRNHIRQNVYSSHKPYTHGVYNLEVGLSFT